MIDKKFWKNVAENWHKDNDGISIPEIDKNSGVELIDPTTLDTDLEMDDEAYDILTELGIEDDF